MEEIKTYKEAYEELLKKFLELQIATIKLNESLQKRSSNKGCGKIFRYKEYKTLQNGCISYTPLVLNCVENFLCPDCSQKLSTKKGCGKQIRNKICGERYFYKDGSYFDAFCERCSPTTVKEKKE